MVSDGIHNLWLRVGFHEGDESRRHLVFSSVTSVGIRLELAGVDWCKEPWTWSLKTGFEL